MPRHGYVTLPPTRFDLWVSRRVARVVDAPVERDAGVVTWAADEKLLLVAVGFAWLGIRLFDRDARHRRRADHLALTTAASAVLPHVVKYLVDRERPDRCVVGWPRHGVPRSGKPHDSFPSGHAMHLGAIAGALSRWLPRTGRVLLWPTTMGLAATRILLLAHWPTDVAAGLASGALLEALLFRWRGAGVPPDGRAPGLGREAGVGKLAAPADATGCPTERSAAGPSW